MDELIKIVKNNHTLIERISETETSRKVKKEYSEYYNELKKNIFHILSLQRVIIEKNEKVTNHDVSILKTQVILLEALRPEYLEDTFLLDIIRSASKIICKGSQNESDN